MSPDYIGMQGERSPDKVGINFKTGVPRLVRIMKQLNRGINKEKATLQMAVKPLLQGPEKGNDDTENG